jgi:hypothetical protein
LEVKTREMFRSDLTGGDCPQIKKGERKINRMTGRYFFMTPAKKLGKMFPNSSGILMVS